MGGYRYGFNGKENDNEIKGEGNQQDYGMRVYDLRLGRFLSVDPLTQEYPWYTPYQFAGNTPIQAIDLDGAEEWMMHQGFAVKRRAQMQMANRDQVARRMIGSIKVPQRNWADKIQTFSAVMKMAPNGAGGALFIDLLYGMANDASITYTGFVDGKNSARGLNGEVVSNYKERVGAGLNTMANVMMPMVGAEMKAAGGLARGASVADDAIGGANKWVDEAGNIKWPANDGFAGAPEAVILKPGARIDRYGLETGSFVSSEGVPYANRSLSPMTDTKAYNVYEVLKPIDALGGGKQPHGSDNQEVEHNINLEKL